MNKFEKRRRPRNCGTGFHTKVWCNSDPCGIICAFITWFFILYAEYTTIGIILYPWLKLSIYGCFHTILFTMIAILSLICHGKAMLTNPGAVPDDAMPPIFATESLENGQNYKNNEMNRNENKFRSCRRCQTFKPNRAHHCSICERCIIKMDHHCPWVNNCVGFGNHKFFLLFIFYVFILSIYAIFLICARYAQCLPTDTCPIEGGVYVMFLSIEAVIFGLFTICMMCDQYSVMTTGNTQIDRLQQNNMENDMIHTNAQYEGIREVFGDYTNKFSFSWILPINIWFPRAIKYQMLGYVVKEDLYNDKNIDEENMSEMDSFIGSNTNLFQISSSSRYRGASMDNNQKILSNSISKENLNNGWSIEKHVVPNKDVHVV